MKQFLIGEPSINSAVVEEFRKSQAVKVDSASVQNEQNDDFWTFKDLEENALAFIFTTLCFGGLFFILPFLSLFF